MKKGRANHSELPDPADRSGKSSVILELLESIVATSPAILFAADRYGVCKLFRGGALGALGIRQDQLIGHSIFEWFPNELDFHQSAQRALQGERVKTQLQLNGIAYEVSFLPWMGKGATIQGVVGLATDVTEWVELEQELRRRALYDRTTGLPNRNLLHDNMVSALQKDPLQPFALIAIGLKRFSEVNSTFGYQYGDQVLKQVGQKLRQYFPQDNALVARIGGDEFAVMVPHNKVEDLTRKAAEYALGAFDEPYHVAGNAIALEASIGVAFCPGHGTDPDMLLRRSGIAAQRAKAYSGLFAIYRPETDENRLNNVAMLAELREAVISDQLYLHYQPKVDLRSGKPVGAEALVRWEHPTKGPVSPGSFIPLAERTGVIHPLTQWVTNTAVRQVVSWNGRGYQVPIAINLSSRSFQSEGLLENLHSLLDVWGIEPSQLELEITETAVMTDPQRAASICRQIHDLGIHMAIDDFGVGHSPLAYLRDLHVAEIKVDRTFITDLVSNPDQQAIVRAIITMGRELGMVVTAEGIEDRATYDLLAELGCSQAQGYFIGRPMAADALLEWLDTWKGPPDTA